MSSVLLLHSSSKPGPGEPRVLSLGCLCDFRGISFPQPLARRHRVGFAGWQVAGKPRRVKIGRETARKQGLICAEGVIIKGVAGVSAKHPACGSVLSCCMKEILPSKTRQGTKHPTNSRGKLWQPWGKCPFTCLCLSLGLFAVRSEIGGDL